MPTSRKSKKKTVSIMETPRHEVSETPPDPCPLCGRGSAPTEPAAGVSQVSKLDGPAVTAEKIEAAFDELPVALPPSMRSKLSARLLKKGLHPSSEEGVEIVKTTCQAYLSKKEKARTASAARRVVAKQRKEADMQPEAADH